MRLYLAPLLAAVCLFHPAPSAAAEKDDKTREVVIQDIRSPELKTYRAMLAGLDEFDDRSTRWRRMPRKCASACGPATANWNPTPPS